MYSGALVTTNQPGRFFDIAKTHKFTSIERISFESLKLRPIMDQTWTYIYNASKVVTKCPSPLSKNEFSITDTLCFPELLKNGSNDECYEDVSYDVESLFKSILVQETKDYTLQRIYVRKEIKPSCKKSIFKKLLLKLTKECVFSVNNWLIKQIDGCPMGGPISVIFTDIFVSKMEEHIVAPMKPPFSERYVDDTYICRKKDETDSLFEKLNSYHLIIKFTIEKNPTKFLDTEIIRRGCEIETKVYNKSKKLPVHWSWKIQTRYKRNAITGELHRAKRIAGDFNFEVKRINKKFLSAGFPRNFIRNTTEYFNKDKNDNIIPEWLFDERKLIILRLPFSESNEKFTKSLIKKFVIFTNNKCKFSIAWNTRSLFQIKDNDKHYSCAVYEGNCSCGVDYIGESVINVVFR